MKRSTATLAAGLLAGGLLLAPAAWAEISGGLDDGFRQVTLSGAGVDLVGLTSVGGSGGNDGLDWGNEYWWGKGEVPTDWPDKLTLTITAQGDCSGSPQSCPNLPSPPPGFEQVSETPTPSAVLRCDPATNSCTNNALLNANSSLQQNCMGGDTSNCNVYVHCGGGNYYVLMVDGHGSAYQALTWFRTTSQPLFSASSEVNDTRNYDRWDRSECTGSLTGSGAPYHTMFQWVWVNG